jgi:hypothetical protein
MLRRLFAAFGGNVLKHNFVNSHVMYVITNVKFLDPELKRQIEDIKPTVTNIKVVTLDWLENCITQGQLVPVDIFLLPDPAPAERTCNSTKVDSLS